MNNEEEFILDEQCLTIEDANRYMASLIEIVQHHVNDPIVFRAIIDELYTIIQDAV